MTKVTLRSLVTIFCISAGVLSFGFLRGQTMAERVERLLRESVSLAPDDLPSFTTKGGMTYHPAGQKDRLIFVQRLTRKSTGVPGKERADIIVRLGFLPNREMAYESALSQTTSQRIYPDGAGMPQGSWTSLPIGQKSWATAPDPEQPPAPGIGNANLVVWDDQLALRVIVNYQPIGGPKAKTAVFLPIAEEDLELAEFAARTILVRTHMVLIEWKNLPQVRLTFGGKQVDGRRGKDGQVFVPVKTLLQALGGKIERRHGSVTAMWGGKKVVMPIGARQVIAGKETVQLSLPILWDGKEVWVEQRGVEKAFGLALR